MAYNDKVKLDNYYHYVEPWWQDAYRASQLTYDYNLTRITEVQKRDEILRDLFAKVGEKPLIEPPFHCDRGFFTTIGNNFYANFGFTLLDSGEVVIGDDVQIGPNVTICTASHPVHPEERIQGGIINEPVHIGNNVWIGAHVFIGPGVHIGDNAVIGAGSIVIRDIPANTVAVGNPCRVLRQITDADRMDEKTRQNYVGNADL
ncbi:sugar O-acetyltransferase [Neobittarella massiliensis]|uniref:Acetyltransferase n=1 Tax=Neobittarella massiliensis (ex Bilen et al. 2018) TaxID=2041842 RepID=A0A8J6IL77_9FIRM|nr:sugar O-acetyltransferase [Neobittarella massiliensis]MBC3515684.1 sugar O-acetyltransferase [Neobittarella massiliensis]